MYFVAISLLTQSICSHADSTSRHTEEPREPVRVRIAYAEVILVISDDKGVCAIRFEKTNEGARYQYRFRRHGENAEKTGSGLLLERYRYQGTAPELFKSLDKHSKLTVIVEHIRLDWSRSTSEKGWVHYYPEKMRVHVADFDDYAKIDLGRFNR